MTIPIWLTVILAFGAWSVFWLYVTVKATSAEMFDLTPLVTFCAWAAGVGVLIGVLLGRWLG